MFRSTYTRLLPAASLVLALRTRERLAQSEGLSKNFLADAVTKASPSVANIVADVDGGFFHATSSGSGFLIEDNFVVTNAHVVSRKGVRGKVTVTLWGGMKLTGYVHSMDKIADIALIKLDQVNARLPVARLGQSSELSPGEFVAALGSPLTLSNSVTFGIVSTVSRNGSELGMGRKGMDYIQTDAPINMGNSGGPLINMDGEVVGINTMKLSNSDGISFAIPIDVAKNVIAQLKLGRAVIRPYVGIKIATMRSLAMDVKVVVTFVEPSSPASFAGVAEYVLT